MLTAPRRPLKRECSLSRSLAIATLVTGLVVCWCSLMEVFLP